MNFIKHTNLFIKMFLLDFRRKWLSLPLLFLFPLIIIGLISAMIIILITPSDNEAIQVGFVDLDQSKETKVIAALIADTSLLNDFIEIHSMSEPEAIDKINQDQLSTYITFPEHFTTDLYEGIPVTLPIVGNPNQPNESQLIKELISSITRHISASQANILTINYYAKELSIDSTVRNDMLFEQFTEFLLYTIGKDKVISEKVITNDATTSPVQYYSIAGWFLSIMVWLFIIYNFLYKENTLRMNYRLKLYGVQEIQEIIAKMIVTLLVTSIFAIGSFIALDSVLNFNLSLEDYYRMAGILSLHSLVYLQCLAIIETIIKSSKLRLLSQALLTGISIVISGTIIPTIYFPLNLQTLLPYSFSNQAFYWLQEIILNERLYADYTLLIALSITGLLTLIGVSLWKERVLK